MIDDDQGKSAAGNAAHGRDGFAELVSAVGLGEVGIIPALEVSRLVVGQGQQTDERSYSQHSAMIASGL